MNHFSQCTDRKLVNAAPQRWSRVPKVLEAVAVNWDAIETMYSREGKTNPMDGWKEEIAGLYSLIKPCTDVILASQRTSIPTRHNAVLELTELKLTTLNCEADLEVRTPHRLSARDGVAGVGGG